MLQGCFTSKLAIIQSQYYYIIPPYSMLSCCIFSLFHSLEISLPFMPPGRRWPLSWITVTTSITSPQLTLTSRQLSSHSQKEQVGFNITCWKAPTCNSTSPCVQHCHKGERAGPGGTATLGYYSTLTSVFISHFLVLHLIPYSWKIWRGIKFGRLADCLSNHQIKTRQNFLLTYYTYGDPVQI